MKANDPILFQAEKIFSQRQLRYSVIDRDVLGEPGWDILLCAFIAQRKGCACSLNDVASEIGLGLATAGRWVDLLAHRGMLVLRGSLFAISEDTETVLSAMFKAQIKELFSTIGSDVRGLNSQGSSLLEKY